MKTKIFLTAVLLTLFVNLNEAHTSRYGLNFNYFYSTLSPYGEWIEIDYNVYAWRPMNTGYNWQPYSNGNWTYTTRGWYWDSYEPYGWAVYHYGRWYYDDYYGWMWVPGYTWAPAWVEWRYDDSYIGWAPLPPYADFSPGFGIHFSIHWNSPYRHWRFVRINHFCNIHINNYYVSSNNVHDIYNRTKYRTNYYSDRGNIVNGGIPRAYVEQRSGNRIPERSLVQTSDRKSYDERNNRNDNMVRYYNPSEKDISSVRNADRVSAKRYESNRSVKTDNFVVGRENNASRDVRKNDYNQNTNRNAVPKTNRTENKTYKNYNSERPNNSVNKTENVNRSKKESTPTVRNNKRTPSYKAPARSNNSSSKKRESVNRTTKREKSSAGRSSASNRPTQKRSAPSSNNKSRR